MTILHSCCFWKSVRKGSIACGIYTALYYTLNAAQTSYTLHEELKYFRSNFSTQQSSIIHHEKTTETGVIFTILILTLSSCGIFTSCLLLYGLHRDCKILLIPWIIVIIATTNTDIVFVVYCFVVYALQWNPVTAILITLDLFLICLNLYALLCVISQYQELKAGRGRALDDQNNRVPNIQYSAQPTATSYLSTRRAITYHETRPTPTQSPTGTAPSIAIDEPSPNIYNRGPRKSVKFPDNSNPAHNGAEQLLDPWTIDAKSPMLLSKGIDTAPLIESRVDPSAAASVICNYVIIPRECNGD